MVKISLYLRSTTNTSAVEGYLDILETDTKDRILSKMNNLISELYRNRKPSDYILDTTQVDNYLKSL